MEMFPSFSGHNSMNLNVANAVIVREFSLRQSMRMQYSDAQYVYLSELTHRVSLTSIIGAVQTLMSSVLGWCCPHYMSWVDTYFSTAKMGRFVSAGWRWAVHFHAHQPTCRNHRAMIANVRSAMRVESIRPIDAIIGIVVLGQLEKSPSFVSFGSHVYKGNRFMDD